MKRSKNVDTNTTANTTTVDVEYKRKGFWRSLKGFFSKLFGKRKSVSRKIALNSRFGHLLENLEPDSDMYQLACETVSLCDESVSVVSQRLISIEKLKMLDEQLLELECFNNMSDKEAAKLKGLLESFISLGRDKNILKYQITDFDSSLTKMEELEDDAPRAISDIRDAEEKQRIFKQDLSYLRGEKEELEYERETLINSMDFIYKFTIGLVIVFGAVVMLLVMLFVFKEANIFLPLTILSILVIITVSMLYILRRRMKFDLEMNLKKQKKAVDMINTKSVVYAYYTNFLSYEYKKFKVRSADMLKSNLRDYNSYKQLTKRFDSIRSIMFQTEAEITKTLKEHGISNTSASLDNFAKTFSIDDKKEYYRELLGQKKTIERELSTLDKRQEEIWDTLVLFEQGDTSKENIINMIVQSYMQHVSNIIQRPSISRAAVKAVNESEKGKKKDININAEQSIDETPQKAIKRSGRKKYKFIGEENSEEYIDIAESSV